MVRGSMGPSESSSARKDSSSSDVCECGGDGGYCKCRTGLRGDFITKPSELVDDREPIWSDALRGFGKFWVDC